MTRVRRLLPWLVVGAVAACGNGTGQIGISAPTVSVSGTTRDYFSTASLAAVALSVDDHPALTATSAANGAYTFPAVSSGSTLRAVATLATYRSTRNEMLAIGASSVSADLFAVTLADAARQYSTLGLVQAINTGIVVVNLRDAAGQPREGIPLASIVLLDAAQSPIGLGPFVFGSAGDVVSPASQADSKAFGGRSRVAFLNVPPGSATLSVTVAGPQTLTTGVVVTAGGATLVQR